IYELLSETQIAKFEKNRELDFSFTMEKKHRFRGNVFQQRGTLSFVFRAIPYQVKTCDELNLPKILNDIAMKPRGLVLVTGVTGSGKSTALASMVDHINRNRACNIITIEDPIEFLHKDVKSTISQREIGSDTLSFEGALRHVLRQDPDVIMIGEVRDQITLDTAMKAADTGHLVFSTLHTTDATQTINRVISFFPPHEHDAVRNLLSTCLNAVISLRLVPTKDGKTRVPACEVLINTAAVKENIRDSEKALTIPGLIKDGMVQYGMQAFDQSLMDWYKKDVVSYDDAVFYSTNPSEFALRVGGIDSTSDRTFSEQLGGEPGGLT
ncbi:MAG: PilT/PilU family type 4a pilus ATPase, partial [Gemmatimonadetes bacterium]|nr:PilT/PilU family type 4a pilus ATPase [Gemmatimonadota bacterium]